MKRLLWKTTVPFLMYVLIISAVSIPAYFLLVDSIWKNELDEHNKTVAAKTAEALNDLKLSDEKLNETIRLWNRIQPESNLQKLSENDILKDSVYTSYRTSEDGGTDRFRILSTVIKINGQSYRFFIQTNIEESEETISAIAIATGIFILLLITGLLLINRRVSKQVWLPFDDTLQKLKTFSLSDAAAPDFMKTGIREFEDLNAVLHRMITHNISVFKIQKEFTENASHELQTPLAVIRNKLDLLLQNKDLTEQQYHLIEEINRALSRSTRINKNLLLLSKIENRQFGQSESIDFSELIKQQIDELYFNMSQKNLTLQQEISSHVTVTGNSSLATLLIDNLLMNAIKYTDSDGMIQVTLTTSHFSVSNSGNKSLNSGLLFKRFSKLSTNNSGTGLGLAISLEICRFHNWSISYQFENGLHVFLIRF